MQEYEENREISPGWSWAILVIFCALIVAWGLLNWALIKDGPRDWDFGALPDAPSASIYSTGQTPEKATPPQQIAPLPEARPREQGPK